MCSVNVYNYDSVFIQVYNNKEVQVSVVSELVWVFCRYFGLHPLSKNMHIR